MIKVLSFSDYIQKTNEGDMFGVTTSPEGNLPPGYDDSDSYEPKDERDIDPSKHKLKLLATDYNEFGVLEGEDGKKYVYYFDSSSPDFKEDYVIFNDETNEYEDLDDLGVEASANDVPMEKYGKGSESWEDKEKEIIELDEELVDDLLFKFQGWVPRDPDKKKVHEVLKKIALELREANESEVFGSDDDFESYEILESEGIHPAMHPKFYPENSHIRQKLMDYLKENPDATYAEAKKFIGEKIAGWKLSSEDFDEAKKMM